MKSRYLKTISKLRVYLLILTLLGINFSCEDFLSIDPPKTQIVTATVFKDDVTARSAMLGVYNTMIDNTRGFASGSTLSITHLAGLSADEFIGYYPSTDVFATNSLVPVISEIKAPLWDTGYQLIYYANSVLEGLKSAENLTDTVKSQLEGEAKFARAFCHFYITNLFGDAPISTTIDYRTNSTASRAPQIEVYNQVISDLIDAQNLLSENYPPRTIYSTAALERARPNKSAATALLARVYLYIGDWTNAEIQSSNVIDNAALYNLVTDLNGVFIKNSAESIWQLRPIRPGYNTNEAEMFLPNSISSAPSFVSLSNSLMNAFEPGDNRSIDWVDNYTVGSSTFYYPNKYKAKSGTPLTEYSMVLRLAEQYLIRAEARAKLNNLSDAISDIDAIRQRAGLPLIQDTNPTISQPDLILAIEQERRIEFFSEWGHRWFDLKRTSRTDVVLEPIKNPNWQSTDVLYPIPQLERTNNPKLTQNPGY